MEIPLFFEGGISIWIQFLLVTHWQQKMNKWRSYGIFLEWGIPYVSIATSMRMTPSAFMESLWHFFQKIQLFLEKWRIGKYNKFGTIFYASHK